MYGRDDFCTTIRVQKGQRGETGMSETHLRFNSNIGVQKPENIINRDRECPFCNRALLTDILAEEGSILLLKNKYPVLQEAYQTVIIETDDCDSELSLYEKDHLYRLMHFGFYHWNEMKNTGLYQSVLFFKNHGPQSGGTIRHPHMQIVGLADVDYHETLSPLYFEGIEIASENGVSFNVSTHPRVGFFEFNVQFHEDAIEQMADYVQMAAHYTLNHFHRNCKSYNLFFYDLTGVGNATSPYAVKIVPRFVTSPLYIGYQIPQVSDRIENAAEEIRRRYIESAP